MDFSSIKTETVNFISSSNSGLSIIKFDEGNSQIHISSADGKIVFYVSCPSSDSASWNVWSECVESQKVLQYVMDSCNLEACSSVSAVLETVSKRLQSTSKMQIYQAESSAISDQDEDYSGGEADDDGDEDNFDEYYTEEDVDAHTDKETVKRAKEEEEEDQLASHFGDHSGSEMAVRRLVKDLKSVRSGSNKFGISAAPKGNNLFLWEVKLIDIPEDSKLGHDLASYARKYNTEPAIRLNMQFPQDYPFSPPFIRVVKPRFKFLTGHVTIGGSICMQMLTKSGWQPANDIESILVQVRAEILSDPNAALDVTKPDSEYSESEAKVAFERMVMRYGW